MADTNASFLWPPWRGVLRRHHECFVEHLYFLAPSISADPPCTVSTVSVATSPGRLTTNGSSEESRLYRLMCQNLKLLCGAHYPRHRPSPQHVRNARSSLQCECSLMVFPPTQQHHEKCQAMTMHTLHPTWTCHGDCALLERGRLFSGRSSVLWDVFGNLLVRARERHNTTPARGSH